MTKEKNQIVSVVPTLSILYSSVINISKPQKIGHGPFGERRIINITGGSFSGKRLSGRILPGGADWQIIRSDGTAELEARYTLETEDGALIYIYQIGDTDMEGKKLLRDLAREKRSSRLNTTSVLRLNLRPAQKNTLFLTIQ